MSHLFRLQCLSPGCLAARLFPTEVIAIKPQYGPTLTLIENFDGEALIVIFYRIKFYRAEHLVTSIDCKSTLETILLQHSRPQLLTMNTRTEIDIVDKNVQNLGKILEAAEFYDLQELVELVKIKLDHGRLGTTRIEQPQESQ